MQNSTHGALIKRKDRRRRCKDTRPKNPQNSPEDERDIEAANQVLEDPRFITWEVAKELLDKEGD